MITKAREAELIVEIARVLGHGSEEIRAWCESAREQFRAVRDEIGATGKRDKLHRIMKTCLAAAKAVSDSNLQDDEWLPKGQFGHRFEFLAGSTRIAMLLWLTAEAAKAAAEKLKLPKAKATPDKDATAHYAYMLVVEFPPRRKSVRRSHEGTTDAAWYANPRRSGSSGFQEPSSSPDGPYLTVAPLLFEYFTGQKPKAKKNGNPLERSCRKVLRHLHGSRGRKRRPQRTGQTAP